ncbi:shikimate kinase [Synechococcus sp. CCY9202]|uniref:shikimate kinase n=1 Tax=Synechococcus sp. CCY9202 TaxID=174698 RepID=UPI002B20A397|nr:shikimate kinase [Synechococcus sp. CCY9202]MEA5424622.1 shikimate kinase [Synechococcus sp. CCY9202]
MPPAASSGSDGRDGFRGSASDISREAADRTTHRSLARRLEGINIYLVGMMGAGKSAVGRPLAAALGYRFLDADTTIEQVAGQPIPAIFEQEGEAGFRALETAVLDRIASWHSLVVATGGGAVTRPENWGHLHQGVVVWLDAADAVLLQRLSADPTPRPLMAGPDPHGRLRELLEQRRPFYAQADLHIVQGSGPPEQVALQVLDGLPSILKERQAGPSEPLTLINGDGAITSSLN